MMRLREATVRRLLRQIFGTRHYKIDRTTGYISAKDGAHGGHWRRIGNIGWEETEHDLERWARPEDRP